MSEVERLEFELELAKLVEADPELRAAAYTEGATAEDIAAFKALNAEIASRRTEYKRRWPPPAPEPGDAAANPEAIAAGVGSIGPNGEAGGDES